MSYLLLDDGFAEHRKIAALPHAAFRLHVTGLCYCARHLTDGHLDKNALRVIASVSRTRLAKLAPILTAYNVWKVDQNGDGFWIRDYLDYNMSAGQVKARKQAASTAAKARWGAVDNHASGNAERIASGNANGNALPSPPTSQELALDTPLEARYEGDESTIRGTTLDRIRQLARTSADLEKIQRAITGLAEADLVNALEAAQGPDIRDRLGAALARLKARRNGKREPMPASETAGEPERIACPTCGVTTRGPSSLAEHVYTSHDGPVPDHWLEAERLAGEPA